MFVKWLKSPEAHMLLIFSASFRAGRGSKAKLFCPAHGPCIFLARHGSWTQAEQTFATRGGRDSFPLKYLHT